MCDVEAPRKIERITRRVPREPNQYPLIKEYTLNHNIKAPVLIKGYWGSLTTGHALFQVPETKGTAVHASVLDPKPYSLDPKS